MGHDKHLGFSFLCRVSQSNEPVKNSTIHSSICQFLCWQLATEENDNVASFTEPLDIVAQHMNESNGSPNNDGQSFPKVYGDTACWTHSILLFHFRLKFRENLILDVFIIMVQLRDTICSCIVDKNRSNWIYPQGNDFQKLSVTSAKSNADRNEENKIRQMDQISGLESSSAEKASQLRTE
jgi:hypothetical protein